MKMLCLSLVAAALLCPLARARQAAEIPPATAEGAAVSSLTPEQRGHALLDEMVAALGGEAWRSRATMQIEGRGAAFFHGAPDPGVLPYREFRRFPGSGKPEAERIEFSKKHDIIQVWTATAGTEITYKGIQPLPKDQVEESLRRRVHSIEEVVRTWLATPGVMVVAEGTAMVGRRMADKVTVLSPNNDAVTIELDAATHLPLRRTFQWRNAQFKDHDEDSEDYEDYHVIQGLPTPLTITRYKNGDMVSQRYLTKVVYNAALPDTLFDPTIPLHGKK
ncbi:MAG: hypothetical protein M3O02_07050 [Acidobacteriota bacterium]|nr:hypothetical protein [Acidobacteriota bacterium]